MHALIKALRADPRFQALLERAFPDDGDKDSDSKDSERGADRRDRRR